jgi:hypothetical protein
VSETVAMAGKPVSQISLSNITGSPATTLLGLAYVIQATAANLPNGHLPTDAAGWANLSVAVLMGVGGALHK